MKSKLITIGALAAVAAVAPASTASAHIEVAVTSVKAHTDRANSALDRAVTLFNRNADRRGSRELARSRRELGSASAEAAKLRRAARTPNARASAARARVLVADQQDQNVEELVGMLDEVEGRVENTIAKAALADTKGRDKAIAIIKALLNDGVPEKANAGLRRALVAFSTARVGEVVEEVRALVGDDVGRSGKRTVARAVKANVEGQSDAAAKLAALIADQGMPAQSKPGLGRAYDAVSAEHGSSAFIVARFSDRMPSFIRFYVEQIVDRARRDAQSLRDDRPTPPVGGGVPTPTPPVGPGGPGGPPFGS